MSEYLVTKKTVCPECDNGTAQHPAWAAFWEKFSPGNWPEPADERAYWLYRGYRKGPPPEEINCPHCEGRGVIETSIGLIEALTELNVIRRIDLLEHHIDRLRSRVDYLENGESRE